MRPLSNGGSGITKAALGRTKELTTTRQESAAPTPAWRQHRAGHPPLPDRPRQSQSEAEETCYQNLTTSKTTDRPRSVSVRHDVLICHSRVEVEQTERPGGDRRLKAPTPSALGDDLHLPTSRDQYAQYKWQERS